MHELHDFSINCVQFRLDDAVKKAEKHNNFLGVNIERSRVQLVAIPRVFGRRNAGLAIDSLSFGEYAPVMQECSLLEMPGLGIAK
jgi:hypothetical protein